jgi:hypothetical protein
MATSAAMKKVAEDFGYQIAFLRSNHELWSIFNQAVNGKWSAARFVAKVRGTRWYKTHSEVYRENSQLKYADPATFKQKLAQQTAALKRTAGELGIKLTTAQLNSMADDAVMLGWSDDQVRSALAGHYQTGMTGNGLGGQVENALRLTAFRNGINVSDGQIKSWAKQVALGTATIEDAQQSMRDRYASTVAPGFAKELGAGQDLYDLASPYMQTMAKTLEINPADVDLFDPTIRKALATSSDKDGAVGSVPLWQFERDLKKDQRWLKTNGARDELDKTARSLSQMFGQGV